MLLNDWRSDVCSSDLAAHRRSGGPSRSGSEISRRLAPGKYRARDRLNVAIASSSSPSATFRRVAQWLLLRLLEIGRAHVCTPVTNAHLVCRLLFVNTNSQ